MKTMNGWLLALGLALADMPTELHVVRVVDDFVASPLRFDRLLRKTALMLRRLDTSIPEDVADKTHVCWRDEFFAGGYAAADELTRDAVTIAEQQLSLALETTYTGKSMAALLHDLAAPDYAGEYYLFWNTYNSRPLPVDSTRPATRDNIPREFMTYFDRALSCLAASPALAALAASPPFLFSSSSFASRASRSLRSTSSSMRSSHSLTRTPVRPLPLRRPRPSSREPRSA